MVKLVLSFLDFTLRSKSFACLWSLSFFRVSGFVTSSFDYWFLQPTWMEIKSWDMIELRSQLIRTIFLNCKISHHWRVNGYTVRNIGCFIVEINCRFASDAVRSFLLITYSREFLLYFFRFRSQNAKFKDITCSKIWNFKVSSFYNFQFFFPVKLVQKCFTRVHCRPRKLWRPVEFRIFPLIRFWLSLFQIIILNRNMVRIVSKFVERKSFLVPHRNSIFVSSFILFLNFTKLSGPPILCLETKTIDLSIKWFFNLLSNPLTFEMFNFFLQRGLLSSGKSCNLEPNKV